MRELARMARMRLRLIRHGAGEFLKGSKLRISVVLILMAAFWTLMFFMFLDAFSFMRTFKGIADVLLDYLFAFLFVSLLVMMSISNAIIAYTSLYHSEETEFLFAMPVPAEDLFLYRSAECVLFSSWSMVTLVIPMILAYGLVFPVPLSFYAFAFPLTLLFTVLAAEIGAFGALMVGALLPRSRKSTLLAVGGVVAILLAFWLIPAWWRRPEEIFSDSGIKSIMDRIAFCQHWALPSRWVSHGMLSAARGDSGTAGFLFLLLLSNVLFLGLVLHRTAHYVFRKTWGMVQGSSTKRRYGVRGALDRALGGLLVFLPHRLRLLVIKDFKTFLRDPAQWSQFLLFFGLLALYIVNLPRFGIESLKPYWHSLISILNLSATCLTLATLTSRFIFPQLSLEGRRIWITGLLPMRRTLIIWGKFLFATASTFLVSSVLIMLSDLVLSLPWWLIGVHMLVILCVCCGLNGLAVGLGALYPKLGTDNPSKIVSSFGGTLNLVCSICFIALALGPVVVPLHLYTTGVWTGHAFGLRLAAALAVVTVGSAVVCLTPMLAGARAFSRMEF